MTHAIGIDLGSTTSVVAAAAGAREAAVVPVGKKERTTPSYVSFDGRKTLLGAAAQRQTGANPGGTFRLPPGLAPSAAIPGGPSPYELARLVADGIRNGLGKPFRSGTLETVVAVPGTADETQLALYRDAVAHAGFAVRGTVSAAQAAATAHGLDQASQARALVVILGGTTLEVTALQISDGRTTILGTPISRPLGGDHWTYAIAEEVAASVHAAHGFDARRDPLAWQRVFEAAEAAKIRLTTRDSASVDIPYLAKNGRNPVHADATITRARFTAMTAHLVDEAVAALAPTLDRADLAPTDLDALILTGGGTLTPAIATAIPTHLAIPPTPGPHPQESTALGAALHAWHLR
ncbi:Hsp70 family protein [Yinghuangia soli]|uniref:Hsp70 family protein n=1 Tax=Yinghuangia soli TaxID=2908204 RepID=A0AA41QAK3_9ACTN|nr:Hsp70 family protein [Yinghuangia soli]MCF2533247.1 Hsp70 family protein [Yinghuangia soli]